jgi:CP family cyanate transporter-like MFS transporter
MENVRASTRPALWLMFSIMLVALNLRPSMAAVGPLLSAIRGDIARSFSLASLSIAAVTDAGCWWYC